MVLSVFLHMSRVFYHGAYKAPREFNWVIGVILLTLTLLLSFTGYLLPWDQLALWAVTVGTNMVVLTSLWITTASPLNTLKGSVPKWEIKEVVPSLDKSTIAEVRNIEEDGTKVSTIEAANVKAAVDEGLITKVSNAVETFTPEDNKFALYDAVTQYLVLSTFEVGGSKPSWLDFQFTHSPRYAVVQFCGTDQTPIVFGTVPPAPECAPDGATEAEHNGFVVLEYNLGDVRFPPIVAFTSSVILFALGLLSLHWYEKDRKAIAEATAAAAAPTSTTPDRVREPANV